MESFAHTTKVSTNKLHSVYGMLVSSYASTAYISKPPVEYLQTRFTNLYLYQLSLLAYSLTHLCDTIDYYIEVLVISNQLSVQSLHRKSYMICYQLRAYPGSGRYFSYAVATQARALEKYRTGYGD